MANSRSLIVTGFLGLAIAALNVAPGWAASVEEIFESSGLLGTFSVDCGKPVSPLQRYYVYRAIDDGHVQRDVMTGPTARLYFYVFDSAVVAAPNVIEASGTDSDGKPYKIKIQVDGERYKTIAAILDGQTLAANGRSANGDQASPWVTKCGSQ